MRTVSSNVPGYCMKVIRVHFLIIDLIFSKAEASKNASQPIFRYLARLDAACANFA